MNRKGFLTKASALFMSLSLLLSFTAAPIATAQSGGPTMLHPQLGVRPFITGLNLPTTMAFINSNELFVLEKNTGIVKHITVETGVQQTALDLAVNNASERGLLGIALDPKFASNHFVYLYWSCRAPAPDDPFIPSQTTCATIPELGADSVITDLLGVPLLGNRVDRFFWDGSMLTFERNLIMLRSFQNDAAPEPPNQGDESQPPRGNHDGGVIAFGKDGKLYIFIGDVGRRGQLQNLPCGPTATCPGDTVPDDQFGGPEPDDAHLTGVVLRLIPDASAQSNNPFSNPEAAMGKKKVGENIKKSFPYGNRNGFGIAVDQPSESVWLKENAAETLAN